MNDTTNLLCRLSRLSRLRGVIHAQRAWWHRLGLVLHHHLVLGGHVDVNKNVDEAQGRQQKEIKIQVRVVQIFANPFMGRCCQIDHGHNQASYLGHEKKKLKNSKPK